MLLCYGVESEAQRASGGSIGAIPLTELKYFFSYWCFCKSLTITPYTLFKTSQTIVSSCQYSAYYCFRDATFSLYNSYKFAGSCRRKCET